jgi:hypothetical protein
VIEDELKPLQLSGRRFASHRVATS